MINGLYSGAAALDTLASQQEIVTNNLMHANSSGHRRQVLGVAQRFDRSLENLSLDLGPQIQVEHRDFQQGRMAVTDRPLDLAILGDGFFSYEKNGATLYTRDGRVFRDPVAGTLVNSEGFPLQGENGPITIQKDISDREITVGTDGTIRAGNQDLGKVSITAFDDNQKLTPEGHVAFRQGEAVAQEADVRVVQFQHELSNVQPISELVSLIINTRQHQAIERATRMFSDTLSEYIRR